MLWGLGVRKEKLRKPRKEKGGMARTAGAVHGAGTSSRPGTGSPEDYVSKKGRRAAKPSRPSANDEDQ